MISDALVKSDDCGPKPIIPFTSPFCLCLRNRFLFCFIIFQMSNFPSHNVRNVSVRICSHKTLKNSLFYLVECAFYNENLFAIVIDSNALETSLIISLNCTSLLNVGLRSFS